MLEIETGLLQLHQRSSGLSSLVDTPELTFEYAAVASRELIVDVGEISRQNMLLVEEMIAAVRTLQRAHQSKMALVDDEELVRMSTADMLMDFGFDVVEAGSAEEALQLIDKGPTPAVVVTDHLMPGMSGGELARALRSSHPQLPVLIVSGYAEAEGIAPDTKRLTKPFRNADLADSLAGLVPGFTA